MADPTNTGKWYVGADVADNVPQRKVLEITHPISGEGLLLFREHNSFYCISNKCSHKDANLCRGDIEDLGNSFLGSHKAGCLPDGMPSSSKPGICIRCPKHQKKFAGGLYFSLESGAAFVKGPTDKFKQGWAVPTYDTSLGPNGMNGPLLISIYPRGSGRDAVAPELGMQRNATTAPTAPEPEQPEPVPAPQPATATNGTNGTSHNGTQPSPVVPDELGRKLTDRYNAPPSDVSWRAATSAQTKGIVLPGCRPPSPTRSTVSPQKTPVSSNNAQQMAAAAAVQRMTQGMAAASIIPASRAPNATPVKATGVAGAVSVDDWFPCIVDSLEHIGDQSLVSQKDKDVTWIVHLKAHADICGRVPADSALALDPMWHVNLKIGSGQVQREYTVISPLTTYLSTGGVRMLLRLYQDGDFTTQLRNFAMLSKEEQQDLNAKGEGLQISGPERTLNDLPWPYISQITSGQHFHIGMVAGGTGIAPCLQVLMAAAGGARRQLRLVYSTRLTGKAAHDLQARDDPFFGLNAQQAFKLRKKLLKAEMKMQGTQSDGEGGDNRYPSLPHPRADATILDNIPLGRELLATTLLGMDVGLTFALTTHESDISPCDRNDIEKKMKEKMLKKQKKKEKKAAKKAMKAQQTQSGGEGSSLPKTKLEEDKDGSSSSSSDDEIRNGPVAIGSVPSKPVGRWLSPDLYIPGDIDTVRHSMNRVDAMKLWHGRINAEVLRASLPWPGLETRILVCGPDAMNKCVIDILTKQLGYPVESIIELEA
eukprot:Clim_evm12s237 gene=Clim_evmTU12s237